MIVEAYRLVRREFADTAFTGRGAKLHGGRWKPPGWALIYTADSLAMATLELLVHLPALPLEKYACIKVAIPSKWIERVELGDLPKRWNRYPAPRATQEFGRRWLEEAHSVALGVPSVVVPQQWNYLLNPLHPRFGDLEISSPRAYRFDRRLFE